MKKTWPTKWRSNTKYVDYETGEEITKHNAKQNYQKIQTIRYEYYTNYWKTKGIIEYTIRCKHKRQGELPFTD